MPGGETQRQCRDVLGRDGNVRRGAREEFGIDTCAIPVLLKAVDFDPTRLVIPQRPGGEVNRLGRRIAAGCGQAVDPPIDLLLGGRRVFVARLGADDVDQPDPLGGECPLHLIGRLFLPILFAAIGHGRAVEQVDGIVGCVVEVPEFALVPGGVERFALERLEKVGRFGESGARRCGDPGAGIVRGEMPGRGAPHRETSHHQPIFVDRIVPPDVLKGFEQIDLAGKLGGVAIAPVGMQHKRIGRQKLARRRLPAGDEIHLAQRFAPAMTPDVEPESVRRAAAGRSPERPTRRAAPSLRSSRRSPAPPGRWPSSTAPGRRELAGPFKALLQQGLGGRKLAGVEKLVVCQRIEDGFAKNLHVRQ